MEITFMPRRRVHSLNFLDRFKGKLNKVDRYTGIQGVLSRNSHRYDTIQSEVPHSKPSNSTTIDHPHPNNSRVKKSVHASIDCNGRQSMEASQVQSRRVSVLSKLKRCTNNAFNKENIDDSNLMQSQLFLPKLNTKSIANSKCSNRIKSRILTRKQSKGMESENMDSRVIFRHNISRNLKEYR